MAKLKVIKPANCYVEVVNRNTFEIKSTIGPVTARDAEAILDGVLSSIDPERHFARIRRIEK